MSYDQQISNHYQHGDLIQAIETALSKLGKSPETVTIEDLAPVDEFHIGGRQATDHLMEQLNFEDNYHAIDIGCGLGGASRYVASKFCGTVTGIDLTSEYIETGKLLTNWLKLGNRVRLEQASALSMPFDSGAFNAGFMLHVGMNIDHKVALFKEIFRVLKPGSCFGLYDVMRQSEAELVYPVPWATDSSTSYLATLDQYRNALTTAGFEVIRENNRHQFAIDFFARLRARSEKMDKPPRSGRTRSASR